jgi:hydroxymethylglutaryl-CoA lyase
VSPKAIPQMVDTAVLEQLIYRKRQVNYTIIANTRGAEMASEHAEIQYLGILFRYPRIFRCVIHTKPLQNLVTLEEILEIADKTNGSSCLFVMGFGNPWNPWDVEIVVD